MPKHSHLCVKLIESTLYQLTIKICQRLFVQHAQTFSHLCAKMIESTLHQTPQHPPPPRPPPPPPPPTPPPPPPLPLLPREKLCVYNSCHLSRDKIIIPPTYGALILHIFDVIKRFSEYYMSLFLSSSSSQYIRKFVE